MLNLARFWIGNLLVGWALAHYLGQHVHYPDDLPIRFRPELPALIVAAIFSLISMLGSRFLPTQRWLRLLGAMVFILGSVALAGAGCALLVPGMEWSAGAQIGLIIAYHSPLLSGPALIWALLWGRLSFPPAVPAPPGPTPAAQPQTALPADDWIGSTR